MRRRGLKSAVAKLESRKRPTQFRWPIILAQYQDEGCGEIVGLKSNDESFARLYNETDFAAFALRVQDETGGPLPINAPRLFVALYAEPAPALAPSTPIIAPLPPIEPAQAQHVAGYYSERWLGGR